MISSIYAYDLKDKTIKHVSVINLHVFNFSNLFLYLEEKGKTKQLKLNRNRRKMYYD